MTARVVNYRTEAGTKPALVREARTLLHVLTMDGQLSVRKVPKAEARYMRDLERNGKPYPVSRAARTFRSYGRRAGITKAARKFLRGL